MPTLAELDSPVRSMLEKVQALNGLAPDMDGIGRTLAAFARDTDYLAHHMAKLSPEQFGNMELATTGEDDPYLLLVHRPEGVMSKVHSHSVWVALAPITGTETHRHFEVKERRPNGKAGLAVREERHLDAASSDYVTMTPPEDVHEHGHVSGIGEAAYILVLTGKPQIQFERQQYDPAAGTWETLAPGVMQR